MPQALPSLWPGREHSRSQTVAVFATFCIYHGLRVQATHDSLRVLQDQARSPVAGRLSGLGSNAAR